MTGTNVFIRGTTQFRADARNFSLWSKYKDTFISIYYLISNQLWRICGLLSTATFCKMLDSKHLWWTYSITFPAKNQ